VTFTTPGRTGRAAFIKAPTLSFPDTHQSCAFICFHGLSFCFLFYMISVPNVTMSAQVDLFEAQPCFSSLVSYWFSLFVGVSQWGPRCGLASSFAFCITPRFPPTTCSSLCLLCVNTCFTCPTLRHWTWRWYVPPKHRFTFIELQGVISQNTDTVNHPHFIRHSSQYSFSNNLTIECYIVCNLSIWKMS
jgi:hypothetical protein